MKQQISSKKVCIILFIMITLQVLFITNGYIHKKDYHSDEVWSFGLANSYYEPYIYINADETQTQNMMEWLSGDVIRDYVSVSEDNRFSYDSVLYNIGEDQHPPLFFMIIHTISSIFPGTYTLWYGYIVNVIAFIIAQIYMYKLVRDMSGSKNMGICMCMLWGFSVGAMSMTIFVRHYAVSVMLMMISLYLHNRILKYKDYGNSTIIKTGIVTFLGCMCNHYFTMCEFFIAAYTCIYLLLKKQFKVLLKYALLQLAAVAMFLFVVFPAAISQIFSRSATSSTIKKANYDFQFWCCLNYMFNELFGINTPIYGTMFWVYFDVAVMILAIVFIVCCIIFRNERWFRSWIKNTIYSIRKWVYVLRDKIKRLPVILPLLFVTALMNIVIIAYMISTPLMAEFTDRYLFVSFPMMQIFLVLSVYYICSLFIKRKNTDKLIFVIMTVGMILVVRSHLTYPSPYLFTDRVDISGDDYITNEEVNNYLDGNDCIIGYDELWCLTMAGEYAFNVDNFYVFPLSLYEYLPEMEKYSERPQSDNQVYLFCDIEDTIATTTFMGITLAYDDEEEAAGIDRQEFMDIIGELSYVDRIEYIGYTYSFGRKFELYRIK